MPKFGTFKFGEAKFGAPWPLDIQATSGYHCFIKQYVLNKIRGDTPWKLPTGVLWD